MLAEAEASLQVEALHGKRAKVKASHVLLRFERARSPGELLAAAEAIVGRISMSLSCGRRAAPTSSASTSSRASISAAPPRPTEATRHPAQAAFGAGLFPSQGHAAASRAAPAEIVQAALAGLEKKRQQQERIGEWVERAQPLRDARRTQTAPCASFSTSPIATGSRPRRSSRPAPRPASAPRSSLERCGALGPTHDYHLGRFLFEYFPRGPGHAPDGHRPSRVRCRSRPVRGIQPR